MKKINKDHLCTPTNISLSPAMKRRLRLISFEAGLNANNQDSISHGIQVLVLRDMEKIGIGTHSLYPTIRH
jgi:hypothetical protein